MNFPLLTLWPCGIPVVLCSVTHHVTSKAMVNVRDVDDPRKDPCGTSWFLNLFCRHFVTNREKHERSREPVHIDVIRKVAEAVSIPVIANGVSSLVKTFEDIQKYRLETGCSSVMLARAAQWNPSIFR